MSRKILEVRTVAATLNRMFPGLVVDVVGLKRAKYFEVRATHELITRQLANGNVKLEAVIAEVQRACPQLIAAKAVAAKDCPTRPTPAGIQFRFPLAV
jgi:hypothetical protein